ncbi:hypothetical protein IVA80_15250 [Bradyrhizobium sp. 139]|uniref:hypothetical protein n=1 Tax=Bradyrhizobium sp. 139 TaxID=2782616 RepID=UPI001FFBCA32|nr:hypothetical protein [Bradyrhizobium sp. 139]MCK1742180.1 hypothetical protein [Bradyrhizobium sp. 139]
MSLVLDRLMSNARTHLPGATDPVLQLELFNVLNDFFQVSNIWQEDIAFPVLATDAAGTTYPVAPVALAAIVRFMWMLDGSGRPAYGTMATPGEIQLLRQPSQDDTYTVTVALTVNDPAGVDGFPEFPEWVAAKYSTGLVDGVLGRMMAQPAKPYSNMALAGLRTKSFKACVSQAKAEALHKNVNNGQSWRFPRFAK